MEARWGRPPTELDEEEPWQLEARYLALGLVGVICVLSPERIVIGGGIMSRDDLLGRVQREIVSLLNGYVESADVREGISGYVTLPALGARSGVLGAIALAQTAQP